MKAKTTSALTFIFITVLIDVIGLGIIIPIIPDLIMELTGEGVSEASSYGGWLLFAYAIMQFIFSPILGGLSDKYGRRPILLISLFGLGVDYIFHALAPTLTWLFIGRVLAGICGASFTTANAYIADVSTPEKRAQNFGLIGAAFGLGFIIGPVIGGLVGDNFGVRTPFYVAAGLSLLNVLYGFFVLPESLPVNDRRAFSFKRSNPLNALLNLKRFPMLKGLVLSFVLIYIASHAVQSNWSFFTKYRFEWSKGAIGISLAVVGVVTAIVQGGLIRVIIPKLGVKKSVFIGFALYGIGLVLFGVANSSWMMYAFIIPYCLGGIGGPALQSIISDKIPINEQGELQGTLTSLMSATAIVGPLFMTNLFSYFTSNDAPYLLPSAPFLAGALLVLLSTLFLIKPLRNYTPSK
jgi:DHA1 family tetracycline resistance protein-like MFS transporter